MRGEDNHGRVTADFETAKGELADRLKQETQGASEILHDARDELTRMAGDYGSEAKQALYEKAEDAQRDICADLKSLGGALRAASDHLANNKQQAASKFALDAAGGLERLSTSLKDRPFKDVLGEIQSFGRENSGALLAGSVLAGVALGRFIKSSPPSRRTASDGRLSGDSNSRSHHSAAAGSGDQSDQPSRTTQAHDWRPNLEEKP
ncbi:hypothetical protein [Mesorhizobium sp. M4A.F.Ca.ET.022.05.2.1]|uniref:hypothetical protein n=1 Tax=Mesorhizobium sp. M4A.F.Ca.ET.022.05.2.1 TaxID=2496653 RepID=UPI0016798FA1|nr:hypothetical protein [Mesorhizobium sp. M4A.F.Ca.ET.022.05.2.1]